MLERTYTSTRLDDAMAAVKRDLGDDAVILSSRSIDGSDNGRRRFEVVAAPETAIDRRRGGHASFERRLIRKGVPATLARRIVDRLPADVGRLGTREPTVPELASALAGELGFGTARPDRRVVALVGPTGVGKTTTVAKLAAIAGLVERRPTALVSMDHFRIGATEQLECYAELVGVPLEVAHDVRSLEIALRRLHGAEAVFIDTAGRSPRDAAAIAALADALRGVDEPVDVRLCVPASLRQSELEAVIARHAVLRPDGVVATKVDEAIYYGSVVAAGHLAKAPLVDLTIGQRVPEDIVPATPKGMAELLLGEGVHE